MKTEGVCEKEGKTEKRTHWYDSTQEKIQRRIESRSATFTTWPTRRATDIERSGPFELIGDLTKKGNPFVPKPSSELLRGNDSMREDEGIMAGFDISFLTHF